VGRDRLGSSVCASNSCTTTYSVHSRRVDNVSFSSSASNPQAAWRRQIRSRTTGDNLCHVRSSPLPCVHIFQKSCSPLKPQAHEHILPQTCGHRRRRLQNLGRAAAGKQACRLQVTNPPGPIPLARPRMMFAQGG